MPASFFDSNIVVYSASSDTLKAGKASSLLEQGGVISIQVLNEVANVARRKMGYDWDRTLDFLSTIRALAETVDMHVADHEMAMTIARRHRLAIYDAMIVAVALRTGCEILYSEDMHHGLLIGGQLTIVNPLLTPS